MHISGSEIGYKRDKQPSIIVFGLFGGTADAPLGREQAIASDPQLCTSGEVGLWGTPESPIEGSGHEQ